MLKRLRQKKVVYKAFMSNDDNFIQDLVAPKSLFFFSWFHDFFNQMKKITIREIQINKISFLKKVQ